MRYPFCLLLSLVIACQTPVHAENKKMDPVINQYLVDLTLEKTLQESAKIKTGADAAKAVAFYYGNKDLRELQDQLRRLKTFPKLEKLNRGFAYEYAGKKYTFVIEDLMHGRYSVNKKANWTFDQTAPLTAQLQALSQSLEKQKASASNPFFDSAYADGGATMILIGILIAGIVVPILTDITNTYLIPEFKAWKCKDVDPNAYATAKFCEDYFKHQASTRPKVPDAKPVSDPTPTQEVLQVKKKCSKANDTDFSVDIEAETGVTVRRTMKYSLEKKPVEMIEEQIKPKTEGKKNYKLKDDGSLLIVSDGGGLYLSRAKEDSDRMTPEKFDAMKVYDKALEATVGIIKTCDDPVSADLGLKASQPGYSTAQDLEKAREESGVKQMATDGGVRK